MCSVHLVVTIKFSGPVMYFFYFCNLKHFYTSLLLLFLPCLQSHTLREGYILSSQMTDWVLVALLTMVKSFIANAYGFLLTSYIFNRTAA
jgi:hypothetical protein